MHESCNLVWQNVSNRQNHKTKKLSTNYAPALIKEVIRRSADIREQSIVVKLPSCILEDDELLTNFAENIELLSTCGSKVIIVHDHTNLVNSTLQFFGSTEKLTENIKIADHKSSQIVEMVLSGHISKLIVSKLSNLGCKAISLSGKDSNLIEAKKSQILQKRNESSQVIDMGFIGEPKMINAEILLQLQDADLIPVVTPIATDKNGHTYLLDVDLTTSLIATASIASHIIFPSKTGALKLNDQILEICNLEQLKQLCHLEPQESKIKGLIEASISAIQNHTENVIITDASMLDSIILGIFTNQGNTKIIYT